MSVLIVGLSSGPIWGCPDTDYAAGQSSEKSRESEKTELKNGQGDIIATAYHSKKNTLSFSGKIKGTVPTDPPGTELTVDGEAAYLDKLTVTKSEGGFADVKLELTQYPDFAS